MSDGYIILYILELRFTLMRGKLDRKEEQKLTKQKPNLSGYCLYEKPPTM